MTLYKKLAIVALFALILWSIFSPVSLSDWFWEILPVLVAIPALFMLNSRFRLSTLSFLLIAIYLMLPVFNAHYEVARVPFGYTLGHIWGSSRNMYDRFVHFSFGALCVFPLMEMYLFVNKKKNFWSYFMPLSIILALSSLYEIFEWYSGSRITAAVGVSFLGSQGDVFDSPKDMAMAFLGAVLVLSGVFIYDFFRKRKEKRSLYVVKEITLNQHA